MTCTAHRNLFGDQMKEDDMGGTCSTYWGEGRCIESSGGEVLLRGRICDTRGRWEDNIKVDHQEIDCNGADWIELSLIGCRECY